MNDVKETSVVRTLVGGPRRVWLLNLGLASAVAILFATVVRGLSPHGLQMGISWGMLAAAFAATEIYVVHLPFRQESESFSLSEVPLVLGLFFVSPVTLLTAQLVGAAAALILVRRQSVVKLAFNLSHFALSTVLAMLVMRAIGGGSIELTLPTAIGALVATFSAMTVGVIAVVAAISLAEGEFHFAMLRRVFGLGGIVSMTNGALAIVGVMILRRDPWLVWLLVVPAVTLFFAYRSYVSESQKHRAVELLYNSTRTLHQTLDIEGATSSLLTRAKEMFRADVAVLTLFPESEGAPATRFELGNDGEITRDALILNPAEGVWARCASEGRAVLLARPIRNERLRVHYEKRGIRDAIVAPIFSDSKVVGTVLVGNHLGDVATFTQDDVRLFETLVNHAGVTLDNARLVTRLQDALARATELNRLKDDFLAMTSHELRTPLTSIQGFVKTLLRPGMATDPAERLRYMEIIDRQTDRLAGLIEDLLVATQLEADAVKPRLSHVSVDALVVQVADELSLRAGKRHIDIERDARLPAALSNEELLHRILSNLVENALKYSPDGSTVRVRATTRDDGIVVSISDEGAGIPVEAQEKIFDRFFQVEELQTRRVGGAGLGLYISRRLAGSLGGRLWLESSGSNGSTFCVWVPTAAPADAGDRRLSLIRSA